MPGVRIDKAVFRELQNSAGADFVDDLMTTFFEDSPVLLAEMRVASAGADADRFRRAVHSLKTNGQTFGAIELSEAARALELAGLSTDPTGDVHAIAALEAVYLEAAGELESLRSV